MIGVEAMKIISNLKKYYLETAVFLCGAAVMVMELVGSRFLAPNFGTSLYVWSSIIGVILGSLSIGYWLGGKISVKNTNRIMLSMIVLLAAAFIFGLSLVRDTVFSVADSIADATDIRLASFFAALTLFAAPNVLLGMVSPYAARLKIDQVEKSGQEVGNLYAISTIGSILGTFAAGFWLISDFGSAQINLWMAALLVIVSMILDFKSIRFLQLSLLTATIGLSVYMAEFNQNINEISFDTMYNRYIIEDRDIGNSNKVRLMGVDRFGIQSGMFILNGRPSDELALEYTRYFLLGKHFFPEMRQALMIGGGAYSFPKKFLSAYPDASIDVVEIDSKLTDIARQLFDLKDNARLSIYHEDGRVFLNRNSKKYDCIYIDAFSSLEPPYHLVTREAVQKIHASLVPGGVVLVNVISESNVSKSKMLAAIYATYKSVFEQTYVLRADPETASDPLSNFIVVALKPGGQGGWIRWVSPNLELNHYLSARMDMGKSAGQVLTDDFAPVEKYVLSMIKEK
jgi:spermidine synthase